MRTLPLVDLAAQYAEVGEELEEAILRVARSQRHVGGDEVVAFEEAFADYLGVRHVIGTANGTDALQLSLLAVGVGPRDEVLVPANTFIATAEAVAATGATPRFVDVDTRTGLIDRESCEARLGPRTRALIPVHLYGRMLDMDPLAAFAEEHGLALVEDAAQAHGAERGGRRAGTVGIAGCFSFYPGKNLGAMGDAGATVTDDDAVADRLRLLRDHGRRGRDRHEVVGFNSRLDPIQAAVLRVKLRHLDRWNEGRRAAGARYRATIDAELLDSFDGPPEAEVHHLFPILSDRRDELAEHLQTAGVATGVHYRQALSTTPAFDASADPCPGAEWRAERQLSLPMHPHLAADDVARVADAVAGFTREVAHA